MKNVEKIFFFLLDSFLFIFFYIVLYVHHVFWYFIRFYSKRSRKKNLLKLTLFGYFTFHDIFLTPFSFHWGYFRRVGRVYVIWSTLRSSVVCWVSFMHFFIKVLLSRKSWVRSQKSFQRMKTILGSNSGDFCTKVMWATTLLWYLRSSRSIQHGK